MAERFIENLKILDLTIDDYDSQIQYQFIESFREMHEEQKKYDGQTRHGLNTDLQRQWNERIKTEITRIFANS
jgi:phage regulator Rha-like protein